MESLLLISSMLVLIVAFIFVYLYRTGLFYKVEVRTGKPSLDTICLAYKFYQGSYREIPTAFNSLYSIVKQSSSLRPLGIYYDDPDLVENGKQRYAIGIILNDADLVESVDSNLEDLMLKNDYNIVWITKINHAVLTEFPRRTFLANIWAVKTVYPKLKEFIKRQKLCAYPYIESYPKDMTEYIVPLCEQEKFFVPEYYDHEINDAYYHQKKEVNKKSNNSEEKNMPPNESRVFVKNSSSSSSTGKKRK